jgi:Fe-coproporphyrin III synthase
VSADATSIKSKNGKRHDAASCGESLREIFVLLISELLRVARSRPSEAPRLTYDGPGSVPELVIWNLAGHCNLSCPHCFASGGGKPSARDVRTDEALRVLSELAQAGVKKIVFGGGEPLLRPDLLLLAEHTRSAGMRVELASNGILLDEAMARSLAGVGVESVSIGIDGLRDFNDRYRGMVGAFERASRGLRHARGAGLRASLCMTLTRRNAGHLHPLIDHALELELDEFRLGHLMYSGPASSVAQEDLTPTESRVLVEELFERAEGFLDREEPMTIASTGNESTAALLLVWIEEHWGQTAAARVRELLRRAGGNEAGERVLSIDRLGRVHPDQFWQSSVIGDVRVQSVAEILAHPLRAELRLRTSRLEGRCGGCRLVDVCRGSSRERAMAHDAGGGAWGPDPACMMTDAEVGAPQPAREAPMKPR